jgi:nucleoside 2-deoxyribosyltransferase
MKKPLIYLAGAIRDQRTDDISWREQFIAALKEYAILLNPLGGKSYDPETNKWTMNGIESSSRTIVQQDFWCVDRADIVVFNFLALAEGYPNIGTLVEFGRATARGALIYSIIAPTYRGHANSGMYSLHPFLAEPSCVVFRSPEDCLAFLSQHIKMLSGVDPHYKYRREPDDAEYHG